MSAVTSLPPPAQASPRAAAEIRALPRDVLTIWPVVATLAQVRDDPTRAGQPFGPCDPVRFARCGKTGYVVVYTHSPEDGVTVHSVRKAVGL